MELMLEENFIDNVSAPPTRARWRNVKRFRIRGGPGVQELLSRLVLLLLAAFN